MMAAKREDVENNFNFIGFIIMENKLKEITTQIINDLQAAEVKTIMVTGLCKNPFFYSSRIGDNVLTAISVARQCGIIGHDQRIFLGDLSEEKINGDYILSWKDFEFSDSKLNEALEPELSYSKMPLRGVDTSSSPIRKSTGYKYIPFEDKEDASPTIKGVNLDYGLVDLDPPFFDYQNQEDYCIAITGIVFETG